MTWHTFSASPVSPGGDLPEAAAGETVQKQTNTTALGGKPDDVAQGSIWAHHEPRSSAGSSAAAKRKPSLLRMTLLSAGLAFLLAASGWMMYRKIFQPVAKPPLPPADLDLQIKGASKKLEAARDELREAWLATSDTAKAAFVYHYFSRAPGAEVDPADVLSPYELHVAEMLKLAPPAESESQEAKTEYLRKVSLVASLCSAAAHRLSGLRLLERDRKTLPAPVLGLTQPAPEGEEGATVTFSEFEKMLKDMNFEYKPGLLAPAQDKPVPQAAALQLLAVMEVVRRQRDFDGHVHKQFEGFLKTLDLSLETLSAEDAKKIGSLQLPGDEQPFEGKRFLSFLDFVRTAASLNTAETLVNEVLQEWSEQHIQRAAQLLWQDQERRLQARIRLKQDTLLRARQKQDLADSHSFALSIFLL